jgi:hypothetical protein
LKRLRKNRVNECHYFDDCDNENEIDEKMNIVCDKLEKMPSDIENMFNKKYPNILDEIKEHVSKKNINMTKETIEDINSWWECYQ